MIVLDSTFARVEENCTHPVLKPYEGGYWWCMRCMERLTNAELIALRATRGDKKQPTSEEENQ